MELFLGYKAAAKDKENFISIVLFLFIFQLPNLFSCAPHRYAWSYLCSVHNCLVCHILTCEMMVHVSTSFTCCNGKSITLLLN